MKIIALVAIGATAIPLVMSHGYIVDPAAQWTQGYPSNGYGSTIKGDIFGAIDNAKYGYGPIGAVNTIKANLDTKGGGSLNAFISKNQKLYSDQIDPHCGLTTYKEGSRSKLPAQLEYTGFTHPGPCEIRCDDEKVLFEYDCQAKYPAIPAKIPYDKAKCANANRMTIHWIAVHATEWQVYTDCVWLEGGSGIGKPSGDGAGTSDTTNTTSTTPTVTPTTTTSTPVSSGEVGKEASAPTPPSTSPSSSSKCSRRQ
ncbi:uncharacterized protein PHALS_02296 [Plasmopara halstedii]|uniref:RxLR-like protein n=1 Tax=Plasmopara halstedii TaxID=4781 RepID=A0A0P1AWU5_PLAHL|nr:uncharacterized protein PHALS_02296 [Plasmopara halstedii]CEG45964.1 hypothetical protein PHALS_02296 [Plasmopara halstedii]|eukprot:XP_024582333.1 hypothetical protein PHALS_02296 [Plasmopara halstedii]